MIDAQCYLCIQDIAEKAAVITSPPHEERPSGLPEHVDKYHLCGDCFEFVMDLLTAERNNKLA